MSKSLVFSTLAAIVFASSGCVRSRPPVANGICTEAGCPPPRSPEQERRARAIALAIGAGRLHSVTLETLGCFGSCPSYKVQFFSNGRALIDVAPSLCEAPASVPFGRVTYAVRLAPRLLSDYGSGGAVDGFGARILLQMSDATTYISNAPSEYSWDNAFWSTESRLDQIVRDAAWSPPIDRAPCVRGL